MFESFDDELDKWLSSHKPRQESDKLAKYKDDPSYAPFFKMQSMGVPIHIVQARVRAAGLDPDVFTYDFAPF